MSKMSQKAQEYIQNKLHKLATEARKKSYSPYSKFKVGAALLSKSGQIYTGTNVENASFGAGICAERTALLKAVSEEDIKFTDIVVVSDAKKPAFPCGLCLQMMAEFFDAKTKVWVATPKKIVACYDYEELLPFRFGPKSLAGAKE